MAIHQHYFVCCTNVVLAQPIVRCYCLVMDRHQELRAALQRSVLADPGQTAPKLRQQAANDPAALPRELRGYVEQIHNAAYKITDEQVTALQSVHSDDEIFEITIAAAVGKAATQLEHALALMQAANKVQP